jgi:hypothetical protein
LSEQRISPSSQNRLPSDVVGVPGNVLGSLFVVVVVVVFVAVDDSVVVNRSDLSTDVDLAFDSVTELEVEVEVVVCLADDLVGFEVLIDVLGVDGVDFNVVILDEAVVVCFEAFVFFVVVVVVKAADEGSA